MDSPHMFNNVLTESQIQYISDLPEVAEALDRIENGAKVAYFSIRLNDSIKATLQQRLGLDLTAVSHIPMRWIRGDTAPHIDTGASQFENTYLLYLTNNPGEFILGGVSQTISANTAFVFNEGILHETINTGTLPRLLLGPMSEDGLPVGASQGISYFGSQMDALDNNNGIGYTYSLTIGDLDFGTLGGYTSWRIATNSTGPADQTLVYTNGTDLLSGNGYNYYYLYPSAPCFLEGTKILCQVDGIEKYIPIESMQIGTLVKTSRDGYKKVELIGNGTIYNPENSDRIENRLYKCATSKYPELSEDLIITGCHSILEFPITEKQKEDTIKILGKLFATDNKYRLMACVDERAEPWVSEGNFTIWHIALENADDGMNYGVYANGGLLVETCSIRFLKNKSNMTFV
jgi:hypothetical protein